MALAGRRVSRGALLSHAHHFVQSNLESSAAVGDGNTYNLPSMGPWGPAYPFAQDSFRPCLCEAFQGISIPGLDFSWWLLSLLISIYLPYILNAWESFVSSVILDCCLHSYKTIEGWLWKLILPMFLWVVNSQGYNFGIDLVYLLIKLHSKTCWNFLTPIRLHKCYPEI